MKFFGMVTMQSSAEYTTYALKSFFLCTPLDRGDRFYLIDNDGSVDPATLDPAITLIRNSSPMGFSANINQILRLAAPHQADLFFLNNDIIFTPNWLVPLTVSTPTVLTPVSNWHIPYRRDNFNCDRRMDLADYLGHEAALEKIAAEHARKFSGVSPKFTIWFFCVKIPFSVYRTVGELDESFGLGGGEDADYCFRCHLAGFPVAYANSSFVLHFMGKSTWRGGETPEAKAARDQVYRQAFIAKWGRTLADMALDFDDSILKSDPALMAAYKQDNFRHLIELLRMPPAR